MAQTTETTGARRRKPPTRAAAERSGAEIVDFAKLKGRSEAQIIGDAEDDQGTDVSGLINVIQPRAALINDGLDRWPELETLIRDGVTTEPAPVKMTITPAMAEKILEVYNLKNRAVSRGWVNSLTRQLEDGLFIYNGDTIRLSNVPALFDGQHRLEACVRSKTPFQAIIVTGLLPEAQITMDTGRKRSAGDQLAILGVQYSTATAAMIRWIFSFAANQASYHPGNSEIISFFQMHQEAIAESVRRVSGLQLTGVSQTLIMALDFVARNVLDHPDRADALIKVCTNSSEDYPFDPIQITLVEHMRAKGNGMPFGQASQYNNFAYAFNHFMANKPNKNRKLQAPAPSEGYVVLNDFDPTSIGLTKEGRLAESAIIPVPDSTPRRTSPRRKS
jgi:hypothetical protein